MNGNVFHLVDQHGAEFTQYDIGKTMKVDTLLEKVKSTGLDLKNIDLWESFEGACIGSLNSTTPIRKIVELGMLYALHEDNLLALANLFIEEGIDIGKTTYKCLQEKLNTVNTYSSYEEYASIYLEDEFGYQIKDLYAYMDLDSVAIDLLDMTPHIFWNDTLYVFAD